MTDNMIHCHWSINLNSELFSFEFWSLNSFCVGVDVDADALSICQRNLLEMEITNVDLIQMDVEEQLSSGGENGQWKGFFDCVIMNPPFGTKGNEGKRMSHKQRFPKLFSDKHSLNRHNQLLFPC